MTLPQPASRAETLVRYHDFLPTIGQLLIEDLRDLTSDFEIAVTDAGCPPRLRHRGGPPGARVGNDGPAAASTRRRWSSRGRALHARRCLLREAHRAEGDLGLGLELSAALEPFFRRFPFPRLRRARGPVEGSGRRARGVGALVLAALLLAAPLALRVRIDNRLELWVEPGSELAARYDRFRASFGSDEFVLVGYSGGDLFAPDSLAAQRAVLERLESLAHVRRVQGIPAVPRRVRRPAPDAAPRDVDTPCRDFLVGDGAWTLVRRTSPRTRAAPSWTLRDAPPLSATAERTSWGCRR
jgi:hypothetical protein